MSKQAEKRPVRLSHVGIQTYDVAAMRDWYKTVLNGRIVFEKLPLFCTVSFDEEHHRIAIALLPGKKKKKIPMNPEIMHVAFEIGDVRSLLLNYERLRDLGIKPTVNINHGATLSCYYHDPDGNECELFVDSFPTKEECIAWFDTPVYRHNFGGGIFFDPEELLVKMRAGATDKELLYYPVEEGMKVDIDSLIAEHLRAGAEVPAE